MFEIDILAVADSAVPAPHFNWTYVGKHAFNLTVLVGALYFILRVPVSSFMRSRRSGMAERFEESSRKLEEAKKIFGECSARMDSLEEEIRSLKSSISEQAHTEKENILRRAAKEKDAILKDVNESIESAAVKAKEEVVRKATEAAMRIAENHLKESGIPADVGGFESTAGEGKWLR